MDFSQCWKLLCIAKKCQHLYIIVPFPLHWLVPDELQIKQVQLNRGLIKPPGVVCKSSKAPSIPNVLFSIFTEALGQEMEHTME